MLKAENIMGRFKYQFTGKVDMCGKLYLLELTRDGFPVIPTVDLIYDVGRLPEFDNYVIELIDGADSVGLEFLTKEELMK